MSKKRHKDYAAKREAGGFVAFPNVVLRSPELAALSPRATKLLCDFMSQYKGDNNGDLCAAMTLMKLRGWKGAATISRAVAELRNTDFIITTRAGGRHRAALYALSFFVIDWCNGKLDIQAPTRVHMGAWRRKGGISSGPLVERPNGDCSTGGTIQPTTSANSPPKEQSGPIPARACSTRGHLSRDTTTTSAGQEQGKSQVAGVEPAGRSEADTIASVAGAGGPISPQAEIQRAPPAALKRPEGWRARYQGIVMRVRETVASAPRRARRLGKPHLQDPYFAFAVALLGEGTGMDAKEVGNFLGRLIAKFGWQRVKMVVQECEDLMLWGFGAIRFVEGYPFLLPAADQDDVFCAPATSAATASAGDPDRRLPC